MVEHQSVHAALEALEGTRALLLGDYVLDTYIYGETGRVSREAPVLVVRKERSEHRLGGAANAAANLAAIGVQTRVVGTVGEDRAGVELTHMLRAAGVEVGALRKSRRTTPQKTRILAGAFGTARQQVLRLDEEPDAELARELGELVAEDLRELADWADVVVISDYGTGQVAPTCVSAARELAKQGHLVCVDSRYRLREFSGVTALLPNLPEATELAGFPLLDEAAISRAGSSILAQTEAHACLITLGRGGMTLFRRDEQSEHVDIVGDEEVTDVTGAGDTVTATFSAALAAGLGMVNAMRLANCAAGVAVMKAGTATVSPQEINSAMCRGGIELETWDS